MVSNRKLPIHGRQIWWRGGDINSPMADTHDAFRRAGCVPETRTPKALATAALAQVCPAREGWLVRPLAKQGDGSHGVEAVREVKGLESNTYLSERISIRDIRKSEPRDWTISSPWIDTQIQIIDAADALADGWPSGHVSYALMRCIECAQGISLRDGGGIYWIPEGPGLDRISALAEALAVEGWSVYLPSLQADDPMAWKAVADAAQAALIGDAEEISAKIMAGELKDRALTTAMSRVKSQSDRLALYEGILGTSIQAAREALSKAQAASTMGGLAARDQAIAAQSTGGAIPGSEDLGEL